MYAIKEFDSEHFGIKIAESILDSASPDDVRSMVSRGRSDKIKCLYFLAEPNSQETIDALQSNKFRLVGTRVGMIHRYPTKRLPLDKGIQIRPAAGLEDAEILTVVSAGSFNHSRFYVDDNFKKSDADALFASWILNDCLGKNGRRMFIAEKDEKLVGFWSCMPLVERVSKTSLYWIAPTFRGRGVSQDIFSAVENLAVERGMDRIFAAVPGANAAAIRTHELCGFVVDSVKLWYHRWL